MSSLLRLIGEVFDEVHLGGLFIHLGRRRLTSTTHGQTVD